MFKPENMKRIAILGAFVTLTSGVAVSKRQASFRFECDGSAAPDYAACDAIAQPICDDPTGTIGPVIAPANTIVFPAADDQNCQISVTINDNSFVVTNQQACQGYGAVKNTCTVSGSGGSAVSLDDKYQVNIVNNPDFRGDAKVKRQQEGDTSFNVGIHTVDARPEQYRADVGDGYPGGTQITISEEQTVTNTVQFSSEVGTDFLGIVSASVGFDVSQEESSTSSTGVTITIDCPSNQVGQLYFQPYYETWFGAFSPSGNQLTVFRPSTNGDGTTKGEYNYLCHE